MVASPSWGDAHQGHRGLRRALTQGPAHGPGWRPWSGWTRCPPPSFHPPAVPPCPERLGEVATSCAMSGHRGQGSLTWGAGCLGSMRHPRSAQCGSGPQCPRLQSWPTPTLSVRVWTLQRCWRHDDSRHCHSPESANPLRGLESPSDAAGPGTRGSRPHYSVSTTGEARFPRMDLRGFQSPRLWSAPVLLPLSLSSPVGAPRVPQPVREAPPTTCHLHCPLRTLQAPVMMTGEWPCGNST